MDNYIQTNGSLDCCTKEEIEDNKDKDHICPACKNVGYILPRSACKSSSAQHDIKKTKKEICEGNKQRKFEFKCICDWSKDDKYGFIPNTKCPVHGKQTKHMLSKTSPHKSRKVNP